MKKYTLTVIITLLYFIPGSIAQTISSEIIEFPIDNKAGNNYKLYPLEENGAILLLKSNDIEKGEIKLVFSKLDKELNQQWTRAFPVKFTSVIIDHYITDSYIYFLVSPKETEYQILQLGIESKELRLIEYENIKDYFITKFKVVGDLCFFGGSIKTYPAVIGYNTKTGRKIILSSVNQLKADLVDLTVDKTDEVISVVLFQSNPANKRGLYINRYDFEGRLISNFFYKSEPGFRFLAYRAIIINSLETLFLGTYALRGSDEAHGIYAMKVCEEETVFLKTYPFVEMDYFLKFLRERPQNRILRKVMERKNSDKDKPLYYSYNVFLQNLAFRGDEIITTVDIFKTKLDRGGTINFIEEGNSFAGYGSRLDPSLERFVRANFNYKEFAPSRIPLERLNPNKPFPTEFDYLSTFSCAFNIDGELLWGNSYVYKNDVSTFIPMYMSAIAPQTDSLIMARIVYTEDKLEEIRFKVSDYKTYTDSTTILELPPFLERDKIEWYQYGGFSHWYENHFLASGIKEVKSGARREVFFLRKITYQTEK